MQVTVSQSKTHLRLIKMHNISKTLSTLVQKYYGVLHQAGTDCRIVIPGITEKIAINLHLLLLKEGLPSYLVVPKNGSLRPSEIDRRILAEGLTSLRHGSMIIITCPGELPNLQDSLVGAGGAIRSFTFQDEWPWNDSANDSFSFENIFLAELLSEWSKDPLEKAKIVSLICDGFLINLSKCISRADILLDQILDKFTPTSEWVVGEPVLVNFLYFSGLPHSKDLGNIKFYIKKVSELTKNICAKHEKPNVRNELLERAKDLDLKIYIFEKYNVKVTDEEIVAYLNDFFDGISMQDIGLPDGLLSLRHCWKGDPDRWKILDVDLLSQLYGVPNEDRIISIEVIFESQDSAVLSSDRLKAVTNTLNNLNLKVKIKGLDSTDANQFNLSIASRSSTIYSHEIISADQEILIPLTEVNIAEGKFNYPLRIRFASKDGTVRVEERANLYLLDAKNSFVAVVPDPFNIFKPSIISEDEDIDKILVDRPVDLYLVSFNDLNKPSILIDYENVEVENLSNSKNICKVVNTIDPDSSSLGKRSVNIELGLEEIAFEIEAKNVYRGEYTLESEYISQITNKAKNSVSKLIKIFDGDISSSYPHLGGVNERTRRLALVADLMESAEYLSEPILVELDGPLSDKPKLQEGCWNLTIRDQSLLTPNALEGDIEVPLKAYISARKRVLKTLFSIFNKDPSRPRYASSPIFINNKKQQIEECLILYLESYDRILKFLADNKDSISWELTFFICSLDSVYFLNKDDRSSGLCLLGPWHPLVVSKRFMMQSVIQDCGERLFSTRVESETRFAKLMPLLEQQTSFRWMPALFNKEKIIEYAYMSASSDPGWMVGLSEKTIQNIDSCSQSLRSQFDLDITTFPLAREHMVSSYLRQFTSSFAANRSISIYANQAYSTLKLLESTQQFLYQEDEPSAAGYQLPGGIHLLLKSVEELPEVEWRNPPICFYEPNRLGQHEWNYSKDIDLLPPIGDLKFHSISSERINMPRGDGARCVFSLPARKIIEGQGGQPSSYEIEFDGDRIESDPVAHSFLSVLSRLSKLGVEFRKAVWTFQLPPQLNFTWNILPGGNVDPAVFVHYIKEGMNRNLESRALWDYKVSIARKINSYYILSKVPNEIKYALNSPVFSGKKDVVSELINDLGCIGIAVGGEAMRSTTHSLGVIGVVAAIRLMTKGYGKILPPLRIDEHYVGFILSADSFSELLGGDLDGSNDDSEKDNRRGDLVGVQIYIDKVSGHVSISFVGIECKYSSSIYPPEKVDQALEQAERSYLRIKSLAESALESNGMPERLALAKLVEFGLRVMSVSHGEQLGIAKQTFVISAILSANFDVVDPIMSTLLFTTECKLNSVQHIKRRGLWIRLGINGWPGVNESESLLSVRKILSSDVFQNTNQNSLLSRDQNSNPIPSVDSVTSGQSDVSSEADGEKITSKEEIVIHEESSNTRNETLITSPLKPILVGVNSKKAPVYFDPFYRPNLLENYNIMITGSPGRGKTQLVKTLVSEIRRQDKRVVMLDFRNDYSRDLRFIEQTRMSVCHVPFQGLPYNPLIPIPIVNPTSPVGSKVINISQHISGIVSILKSFQLGPQQQASLKDIIRECYQDRGIPSSGMIEDLGNFIYPDFNDVGAKLKQKDPLAYNRLDPLFDLNIFHSEFSQSRFDSVVGKSYIINVSDIPSEMVKNAIATIIILTSHSYFNSSDFDPVLKLMFVFDEAHRVLSSEYLARFIRECRPYGVGLILSSQYTTDFSKDISTALATKIIHGNGADRENVKAIASLLGLQGEDENIKNMKLFEAYISNTQIKAEFINTLSYPYYLVYSEIKDGRLNSNEPNIEINGLDTTKISISEIIVKLRSLGLIEEVNGVYKALV
jgi:hypothetical protein